MAQDGDADYQQYLKTFQLFFATEYTGYAMVALPVWEYLITFDQEIDLVWRRKTRFSAGSILLSSTRLCMLLAALTLVPPALINNCLTTELFTNLSAVLNVIGFVQTAIFSAFRVSALHNRNTILFVIVFALGLVPAGTNLLNIIRTTYIHDEGNCSGFLSLSDHLVNIISISTRVCLIAADVIVLAFTWARTYRQILQNRSAGISIPVTECLIRDGTLYFACLLALNIGLIVSHTSSQAVPFSQVAVIMPPILINRFMLNLRQAGGPTYSTYFDTGHAVSTPRFQLSASAVGNMGESLVFTTHVDLEDEAVEENEECNISAHSNGMMEVARGDVV